MTSRAKKPEPKPVQNHHFFASSAFTWAVAETRQQAIADVARSAGADIIKNNVKRNGGLYVWSCRCDCPQDTTYEINHFMPSFLTIDDKVTTVRVPISRIVGVRVQNIKGHATLIEEELLR